MIRGFINWGRAECYPTVFERNRAVEVGEENDLRFRIERLGKRHDEASGLFLSSLNERKCFRKEKSEF
jgi:hypothetical protein